MLKTSVNSQKAPQPSGGYAQALVVSDCSRTMFISGQIPVDVEGNVPVSFEEQARLVWQNIGHQLEAAGMSFDNLIKHTTFLADRQYRESNSQIRQEILGDRETSLTVVIAEIYDVAWLLEIEAVAMSS